MRRLLKLTTMVWVCLLVAGLVVYGLQTEAMIRADFSLERSQSQYQEIMEGNSRLNTRAANGVGLEALEQKIESLSYVPVTTVSYIIVPYDMLALRTDR